MYTLCILYTDVDGEVEPLIYRNAQEINGQSGTGTEGEEDADGDRDRERDRDGVRDGDRDADAGTTSNHIIQTRAKLTRTDHTRPCHTTPYHSTPHYMHNTEIPQHTLMYCTTVYRLHRHIRYNMPLSTCPSPDHTTGGGAEPPRMSFARAKRVCEQNSVEFQRCRSVGLK